MILFKNRISEKEYLEFKNGEKDIYTFKRYVDIFRGDTVLIACENTPQKMGEVSVFDVLSSRYDKETETYTLHVKFLRVCPVEVLYDFQVNQWHEYME